MRVLVCGGRYFNHVGILRRVLLSVANKSGISVLITGDAKGADALARQWAYDFGVPSVLEFEADWDTHGRAAGPIRNQRMLDEGKPDLVVAFPGGRGTADMVRRARNAGVKVVEVSDETKRRR